MHVQEVVNAMSEKVAPKTVRTNYAVLRMFLAAAVDAELIARNPCRRIRLPEVPPRQIRFLNAGEVNRLADELPDEYRVVVYLAAAAGLRWSEVAGLRVGRVDLERRRIEVVETLAEVRGHTMMAPPKSKASRRTVPMPSILVDEVKAHLLRTGRRAQPDELLIQGPEGGPLRKKWYPRYFMPAVKRTGLHEGDPAANRPQLDPGHLRRPRGMCSRTSTSTSRPPLTRCCATRRRGTRGVGAGLGANRRARAAPAKAQKSPLTWEDESGRAQTRTADLYGVNVAL